MAHSCWPSTPLGRNPFIWYLLPTRITVRPLAYEDFDFVHVWCLGFFFFRRHLLGTGRREEARNVVAALNGVPLDDQLVDEAIEELDFGIKAENEGGKATWMECFSTRNNLWKRTGNGMMLQFIQQLNGQNFYCAWYTLGTPFIVANTLVGV